MKISAETANTIVLEISQTVGQDVNLMDDSGLIIASTDLRRVGTRHLGAQKIVREGLECLTISTDQEYGGSKMGINLPICFEEKIVGVIGISGQWDQLAQYIGLIRKATEVLLRDDYLQKKENPLYALRQNFLRELFSEKPIKLSDDFLSRGQSLGIDLSLSYRCLCLSFWEGGNYPQNLPPLLERLQKVVARLNKEPPGFCYRELSSLSVFIHSKEKDMAKELFWRSLEALSLKSGVRLKGGLDSGEASGAALAESREKAEKSLCYARQNGEIDLVLYEDMTTGIFLGEVSPGSRREYLARIFQNMSEQEIGNWVRLLEVFYACEGSIAKTAERLFLHKNTLQYHLKKLATLTGYDPRSLSTAGVFQTAVAFWRSF